MASLHPVKRRHFIHPRADSGLGFARICQIALSASNSFSNLPLLHNRNHDATDHDRQRIDETRQQHRQGWKFDQPAVTK